MGSQRVGHDWATELKWTGGSVLKNPPAMRETQETQGWSLSREDPLEEGMVTHSSILAWRVPWTEEPSGLQPMGSQRDLHDWSGWAHMHECSAAKRKKKDCGFKSQPLSFLFSAFLTMSEFSLVLYLVSFQPGSKDMNEITLQSAWSQGQHTLRI